MTDTKTNNISVTDTNKNKYIGTVSGIISDIYTDETNIKKVCLFIDGKTLCVNAGKVTFSEKTPAQTRPVQSSGGRRKSRRNRKPTKNTKKSKITNKNRKQK